MAGEARERDLGRPLCFNAAFVLTLWALFVNNVDLALELENLSYFIR